MVPRWVMEMRWWLWKQIHRLNDSDLLSPERAYDVAYDCLLGLIGLPIENEHTFLSVAATSIRHDLQDEIRQVRRRYAYSLDEPTTES